MLRVIFESSIHLFERIRPRGNQDCFSGKMEQKISVIRTGFDVSVVVFQNAK
jgi:hypothetical protein